MGRPRLTLLAYSALAATWGSSFLLMKVALEMFSAPQVALGRILIGALTLATLMAATRRRWPRERRVWAHMTAVAVLLCVLPFSLFAWAGTHLPSGMSAILNATTPIWTAIAMAVFTSEARLRAGQVAGIFLGAIGVGLVMGGWRLITDPAFAASLPAQIACLAATASYGLAYTWMARFVTRGSDRGSGYDSITLASVQMVSASGIGLLLSPFTIASPIEFQRTPALCLVALGVFGTGFAYVWNTRVLTAWGSVAASTVTYITPLVGVALGVVLLDERVSWNEPVGAVVIVFGILLVQERLSRRAEARP